MAIELLKTPIEEQEDLAALEEQDLAYSTEESPPVVTPAEGENAVANLEQAQSIDVEDSDIQDLQNPEGGYAAVAETEAQPLIKTPVSSHEADAEAYDNAKGLGLSFVQGVWDGAEEIGFTIADIADYAIDMESPTYFRDYAQGIEFQPTEWRNAGEAAMAASTANALAGGAGQFLSGFVPALKALQVFKASGKVMPWMKKIIGTGVAGAAADFAMWDYSEKRAVDYLNNYGLELKSIDEENLPWIKQQLANALTSEFIEKLKYQKGDSPLEGRTKQALEGFVLGKVLDPIMGALGSLVRLKKPVNKAYGQKGTTAAADETIELTVGTTGKIGRKNVEIVEAPTADGQVKVKYNDGTESVVKQTVVKTKPQGRALTQKELADQKFDQDSTLPKKVQEKFNKVFATASDPMVASKVLLESFTPMLDSVVTVKDMDVLLGKAQAIVEEAVSNAGSWRDSLSSTTR